MEYFINWRGHLPGLVLQKSLGGLSHKVDGDEMRWWFCVRFGCELDLRMNGVVMEWIVLNGKLEKKCSWMAKVPCCIMGCCIEIESLGRLMWVMQKSRRLVSSTQATAFFPLLHFPMQLWEEIGRKAIANVSCRLVHFSYMNIWCLKSMHFSHAHTTNKNDTLC